MHISSWSRRHRVLLAGALAVVVGGVALAVSVPHQAMLQAAQNKKPVKEEEEEPVKKPIKKIPKDDEEPVKKPVKKPPKVEEEEPVKPKPKKPIRVDDDDPAKPTVKTGGPKTTLLARDAEQTNHPILRPFYQSLAVPYDYLTRRAGTAAKVAPVSQFVGTLPSFAGSISVRPIDKGNPFPLTSAEIARIDHYEQIALLKVEELLKSRADHEPTESKKYLSRLQMVQAAKKALKSVLLSHESFRQSGVREGGQWKDVEDKLRAGLLAQQMDELKIVAGEEKNWDESFGLADELARAYPNRDVREGIARNLVPFVQQSVKDEKYEEVRLRMRLLEDMFPNNTAFKDINKVLLEKAEQFFREAQAAREKNPALAMAKLESAERMWPRLPGLRDVQLRLSDAYPILRVGVRDLPQYMTPATACTDAERQAVELIFEELVKLSYDPRDGQRYSASLSEERPRVIPLGRQFQLARDAFWSNGERVDAVDVRGTVSLLKGHWTDLLEEPVVLDAFQVRLTLQQGFIDPLSLMTFKVLPVDKHKLARVDDMKFAQQPIGSGPFVFKERTDKEVVFIANPNYRRAGKPGLPRIREVRFFHSDDPPRDFKENKLHLLLDLPENGIQALKSINIPVKTVRNRRIYFLAVNHGNPRLENQDELRRAIGHAINRTELLNTCFREDLKTDPDPPHRPLNGPYPPGAWAYNAKPKDLHDPGLANFLAGKTKKPSLTLKYPNDDPRVHKACQELCKQVRAATGIDIRPELRTPRNLRQEVEQLHDYELAYYYYDFPDESYWLWPLLSPDGHRNFLHYRNDSTLTTLLQQAMGHRQVAKVQEIAHEIHAHVADKMPFIPLWQLDTHVAISPDVEPKPEHFDPLLVFTHSEEWRKKSNK